jgi:hypothetical protein
MLVAVVQVQGCPGALGADAAPVVILLSSSALRRVSRGIVSTTPPRDSRVTVPALITVTWAPPRD